ncbi:MAG: hypothetical protein M1823_007477, partial [Watsoniomyces obsoletus]
CRQEVCRTFQTSGAWLVVMSRTLRCECPCPTPLLDPHLLPRLFSRTLVSSMPTRKRRSSFSVPQKAVVTIL